MDFRVRFDVPVLMRLVALVCRLGDTSRGPDFRLRLAEFFAGGADSVRGPNLLSDVDFHTPKRAVLYVGSPSPEASGHAVD
jgi:hypothetical protein